VSFLGNFARSLRPGNDTQLAADLSAQRRAAHRRSIGKAAAQGQAWEQDDRARERRGGWRRTTW
jgi:hypothetical protein